MITRHSVAQKILSYLNGELTLAELVDWSENTFIDDTLEPDEDIEMLNDILAYLAAGDSAGFPLTWEIIRDWLERLGHPVQTVIAQRREVKASNDG
jgi:hypothetical protein